VVFLVFGAADTVDFGISETPFKNYSSILRAGRSSVHF
jgi:hypothetical protein